jgi:hypothetical protein
MRKVFFIVSLIFLASGIGVTASAQTTVKQGPPVPASYCISPLEMKLYNMINEYRARYDLPPIPLSKSLCYVASTHVKDLFYNHPDVEPCSFHSWSAEGKWKPFCYPRDEKKGNSVWDKPKELTPYKGKGYEIVYWENNPVTIDSIIPFWKSIGYFNSFLMNTGKWQGKNWNAIGIAICENYASAWFGEVQDPEGSPTECGKAPAPVKKPPVPVKDTVRIVKKQPPVVKDSTKVVKKQPPAPNDSLHPAKKHPAPVHADTTKTPKKQAAPKPAPAPVAGSGNPPAQQPIISSGTHGMFYIIVSSQQPREKSKAYAKELARRGYPAAKVIATGNKVRVSVMEFPSKEQADSALSEVKKDFKDAWMLKL